MRGSNDLSTAYRCAVSPENSAAQLKIRGKKHLAAVMDTSRSGFTVRIENSLLNKLKDGEEYELFFAGEHWKVRKQSHYADDDFTNVGFERVEELTKIESKVTWFQFFSDKRRVSSDPAFLMYMMLAFLFACMALPGMGDSLGTAPRIQKGVEVIRDMIAAWL